MKISSSNKEKLDSFGPYGSGFGSAIGFLIHYFATDYIDSTSYISILLTFLGPILSYVCNTCTHRRTMLFSSVSFIGSIGALFGGIIGSLVFILFLPIIIQIGITACVAFMFPFLISRYLCNRKKRIEYARNFPVGTTPNYYLAPQGNPIQHSNVRCRFCDTTLMYSQICPKCGRKNP